MIQLYQDRDVGIFYDGYESIIYEKSVPNSDVVPTIVLICTVHGTHLKAAYDHWHNNEPFQLTFKNTLRRITAIFNGRTLVVNGTSFEINTIDVTIFMEGLYRNYIDKYHASGDDSDCYLNSEDEDERVYGKNHWDEPNHYDDMDY